MKQKIHTQTWPNKINLQQIITLLIFLSIWVFWSFFYKYNLYFQEQLQLFLVTIDYFKQSVNTPGGFIGYLGEFFTQFYHLPLAGATIITLLLFGLQQLIKKVLFAIQPNHNFFLLSFLPSVWYCMILTNEFYLLSGLIGVVMALLFTRIYMSVSSSVIRGICGLLFIPLVYFLTGGGYLLFLFIVLAYEILKAERKTAKKQKSLHFLWLITFVALAFTFPLLIKKYYFATPHLQAFVSNHYYKISTTIPFPVILIWFCIPVLMLVFRFFRNPKKSSPGWMGFSIQLLLILFVGYYGFGLFANMSSEHIKGFDYQVRRGEWGKIIEMADRDMPKNTFAVNYLNLALAKTGQLGEKMFAYWQAGKEGLFMPYNREHLSAMLGNEVFYQLGLVNVSQQYIFESMEATPDLQKTVRAIKRLAETNLINGQYEVARKYLYKLKQTFFYRKWAKETETYLYNEEKINQHPDWGEKRRIRPSHDYFFSIDHIDQILMVSLHDNPQNKMIFEYLMAYYLVTKDVKNFMNFIPRVRDMGYEILPVSYQEAILYVLGLYSKNPEKDNTFPISEITETKLRDYAGIYTSSRNAKQLLKKKYWNTYWYYYHFR
ncbi:MAG: hypothetical protein GH151_09850 [Bacteroidetes bacterium]|nr:hypothetical protein [Bacteroidota bacterium]